MSTCTAALSVGFSPREVSIPAHNIWVTCVCGQWMGSREPWSLGYVVRGRRVGANRNAEVERQQHTTGCTRDRKMKACAPQLDGGAGRGSACRFSNQKLLSVNESLQSRGFSRVWTQQGPAHREETQRRLSTPRGKKEKDRDTSKQKHTAQKLIAEAGTQWVW